MGKLIPWILINVLAIILIVYEDISAWEAFGPTYQHEQFPIIYLAVIPIMLIAFPILWKKLPKAD